MRALTNHLQCTSNQQYYPLNDKMSLVYARTGRVLVDPLPAHTGLQ